ncbi:hypothetical protein CB1_000568056 [Camelus ferus]|nr:hypothetical protein CB1_000568056 [Camelus ferus]
MLPSRCIRIVPHQLPHSSSAGMCAVSAEYSEQGNDEQQRPETLPCAALCSTPRQSPVAAPLQEPSYVRVKPELEASTKDEKGRTEGVSEPSLRPLASLETLPQAREQKEELWGSGRAARPHLLEHRPLDARAAAHLQQDLLRVHCQGNEVHFESLLEELTDLGAGGYSLVGTLGLQAHLKPISPSKVSTEPTWPQVWVCCASLGAQDLIAAPPGPHGVRGSVNCPPGTSFPWMAPQLRPPTVHRKPGPGSLLQHLELCRYTFSFLDSVGWMRRMAVKPHGHATCARHGSCVRVSLDSKTVDFSTVRTLRTPALRESKSADHTQVSLQEVGSLGIILHTHEK